MKTPVSVIGLGKLGSVLAAVLAHKQHPVVGVDVNQSFVQSINQAQAPVQEPGLSEMITQNSARLRATTDFTDAVHNSEVSFVIVPTPSQLDSQFSLKYILSACDQIGRAIRTKGKYHLVVIVSTVMPGDTGGRILKQLEESSRSKCGKDFGLCYNPEFIALGNIIHDILNPDMILIGENDSQAGDLLESIYQQIVDNQPRYTRTNWVNAELVKLSVNTFVTTKISYANMLSELCDQLPGADIDQVTDAIGLDSRIGRKYLKGGLGYGGPCFPRDNDAFTQLALNLGVSADIALATQRVNARQSNRLAQLVMQEYQGGKVGILGLSYKPFTNFVEKSQGIELAQILQSQGVPVVAWDPESMQNARQVLGDQIDWATSLQDCVEQSNVLVVATQWPQFSDIDQNMLIHFPTIIDCWRMLDWRKLNGHARILTLGKGK